jgi:hypothetical protein
MSIRCRIYTPVGEFIAVFPDLETAEQEIGTQTVFKGPIGQVIIIPAGVQQNSVFYITQE